MNRPITTNLEFEPLSEDKARLWVLTTIDGHTYRNLHLSGPYSDVFAYYRGDVTLEEVRRRWRLRSDRHDQTSQENTA